MQTTIASNVRAAALLKKPLDSRPKRDFGPWVSNEERTPP